MTQAVLITGKLTAPEEDGQTAGAFDLGINMPFTQRMNFDRVYGAPVTDEVIDFGTLVTGGAKGVLVKCTAGSCSIKFTVGMTTETIAWPLQPGAYFLYMNPAAGFPTSAKITVGATATVKIFGVG